MEESAIDFSRIQEISQGDRAFETALLQAYLKDCSKHVTALREALAVGDEDTVRRSAHSIKGASRNIGTTQLHEHALAIESGDLTEISTLEAEFQRVQEAISTYLR